MMWWHESLKHFYCLLASEKKSLLTDFDCHWASEEAFRGYENDAGWDNSTDVTLLQYIKKKCMTVWTHFLFFPRSYLNTSLSKYTWHTFKFLKQPQDGLYLCNSTNLTGRRTTVYTKQFHIFWNSVPENVQNLTLQNINRKMRDLGSTHCVV